LTFSIAACGNDGIEFAEYPAAYPEVLSVGSIDRNFNITANSNFGPNIKIYAPGEDILTILPYSGTTRIAGTSVATPFVTSLVAIIRHFMDFSV